VQVSIFGTVASVYLVWITGKFSIFVRQIIQQVKYLTVSCSSLLKDVYLIHAADTRAQSLHSVK